MYIYTYSKILTAIGKLTYLHLMKIKFSYGNNIKIPFLKKLSIMHYSKFDDNQSAAHHIKEMYLIS